MSATYLLKIDGKVNKVQFPYDPDGSNELWHSIPSSHFMSVDEIAENELHRLSVDDLLILAETAKEDLIQFHFSYGMWIRNTYGLWHPNNPYVVADDLGDGHPDGLSMLVINQLHKRCLEKNDAFDAAMSIIQEKK